MKEELAATIRAYHQKGWSPATSTNYSFKESVDVEVINVSRSGIDKSNFQAEDFILIDAQGKPTSANPNAIPSAETLIHCIIYELFPETQVILHSHSVYPVMLSQVNNKKVEFEGYEVQKGFVGQTTHDTRVSIPIFENSQDMLFFDKVLKERKNELLNHSFIIKKHGTYAWGKNLFEAKRHLETLEYLAQCKWMERLV